MLTNEPYCKVLPIFRPKLSFCLFLFSFSLTSYWSVHYTLSISYWLTTSNRAITIWPISSYFQFIVSSLQISLYRYYKQDRTTVCEKKLLRDCYILKPRR